MTEPRASRQSAFENALTELRAGRIERAEALCNWILESTPQDPAAHQLATTIALRRGRVDEAARWANSSLSLRPDHSPTLIIAARVARAAGDFAQARMWLNRAGRLAPDRPEPAFLTCVMLIEAGDREARTVFEDLLVRFPNFVDGWREIAEALRKLGHTETAVLAFARAAESSADPMDYARLGAALQTINRRREAIVAFRRRLLRRPTFPKPEWRLERACVRRAHCNWPASSLNEP
jgi:predicted Zn-dependent protease